MKKPLTPLQRRLFFMVIRPAAQEVGADLEEYRKRILTEELGVEHMSDVGNTGDFDKLMSRIYQDRGDYARALEYSTGSVSRLAHLAVKAAERIVAAKPDSRGTVYDYIAGVMQQSRMVEMRQIHGMATRLEDGSGWHDFTESQLKCLVMMLNTHVRRRS